jgi:hypothetical protein
MEQNPCKLTLVVPSDAGDRIVALMLGAEPPVTGFTTWQADGHGESFTAASIGEQVRGRVERSVFVAVMSPDRARAIIDEIACKAPIPHMVYWLEPVLEFGRAGFTAPQSILEEACP